MPPFVYNRATKKFVFVPVPADPASPSMITWALGNNTDCCCCPCCQLAPGAQTYTCVGSEKKGDCSGAGGVPKCDAASCTPNPCCNGACCIDGQCSIKADAICASLGGVFKGCGTTCETGICECPEGQVLINGQCVAPPNCCEAENVQLQIMLEISGMADGTLSGCDCLDGTYVADVVDWLEWTGLSVAGNGFGAKLLLQPGCVATDANGESIPGQVFLEWACDGSYGIGDWGFRQPMQPGGYPPSDYVRVELHNGTPCVGGSATGYYWNTFNSQCDPSSLTVNLAIQ